MEVKNRTTNLSQDDNNICRVCLSSSQNNQCIFSIDRHDPESTNTNDLPEKLRLCGGVEILENDGLPARICAKCTKKLNDAHELRKQCQRADIKLRELYGKVTKKYTADERTSTPMKVSIHGDGNTGGEDPHCNYDHYNFQQDRSCQTDYTFPIGLVKVDSAIESKANNDIFPIANTHWNIASPSDQNFSNDLSYSQVSEESDKANSYLTRQSTYVKHRQAGYEKFINSGKETYRTRRVTMFKRVTSMESLRNHKERQRQYIKKSVNVKRDSTEGDSLTNVKNTCNGVDGQTNSRIPYVCPQCNRCYSRKKSLDRHVLTHKEQKFTCEKCNKQFFQLDKLLRHNKLHKPKEKPQPVLCKICNKNFRKTDTMVRHLNVHKRANPKEVLSILKEIRDRRKLENSLERNKNLPEFARNGNVEPIKEETSTMNDGNSISNTLEKYTPESERKGYTMYLSNSDSNTDNKSDTLDEVPFHRCKHCTKCYATEKSLQRHLLIHDEKKFVCNVCNMKFFRQDRLKSHKDRYGHDEDRARVELQKPPDDKSAIKLINSWIREELDSDNEGKGFPCKICGKSYDTKKSLLKHQLNIHDSREENCGNCGKICTCVEKGKDQAKVSVKPSKLYTCDECDKSFEKEIKLQRHVRIHKRAKEQQDANFKRFLCHICSKTFRQNTGLMFHMRTHTGYKPHVCKYCGRGFTSNSNCINHERTHTGDRPFVCHFCSAAFAKSCTLKAHITTHTGEANYHCKTCGKSFRRLKYLKEHRFTHTGEKPYACKICGTAYSHSGSLFVHEKKCKAQYGNYQSSATQNTQAYCQPHQVSPTVITPIIAPLPQAHLNNISGALNTQTNKTYMDGIQRMNSQGVSAADTSDLHVHANCDMPDVSSTVRNFALIGQMFQS